MKFERKGNDEYPVETEKDLWLENDISISDLIERVKNKWPNLTLDDITITAYRHHQYCIGYDLYDSSDYVNYLYISID